MSGVWFTLTNIYTQTWAEGATTSGGQFSVHRNFFLFFFSLHLASRATKCLFRKKKKLSSALPGLVVRFLMASTQRREKEPRQKKKVQTISLIVSCSYLRRSLRSCFRLSILFRVLHGKKREREAKWRASIAYIWN